MLFKVKNKEVIKFEKGDIIINDHNTIAYMIVNDSGAGDYKILDLSNGNLYHTSYNSVETLILDRFGKNMLETGYSKGGYSLIKHHEIVISN